MPDKRLKNCRDAYKYNNPPLCRKHPRYKAIRKPRAACETCWEQWFITQGMTWGDGLWPSYGQDW